MHIASRPDKCLLHHEAFYWRGVEMPSDRLKQSRERAGYETAKSAAEAMGVPVATYIQHENGARGIPATKAERYAKFFRVTPEFLLYGKPSSKPSAPGLGPTLFVKGAVAAGVWREAVHWEEADWQTFTGSPDVVAPMRDRFGVRCEGQSMNLVYPAGTVLECVKYWGREEIPSGRRVIVQRERDDRTFETTVKEYVIDSDGVGWLVPRSTDPSFQAFRADLPEPGVRRVEITAVVVASIRYEN